MKLLWLVLGLLVLPFVSAQYYADVLLDVQADGSVVISGISNYRELQPQITQQFTNKEGERWILNVTIPEQFDDYVITAVLPKGANLNYVSSRRLQILTDDERVVVKVVGSNVPISLGVQYTIENAEKNNSPLIIGLITAALVIIAVIGAIVFFRKKKNRVRKTPVKTFIDGLPARQQEIVSLLQESGGKLTQKQIEQSMSIPKSSVSRNIDSLERRGIIKKESYGMTNIITLQ